MCHDDHAGHQHHFRLHPEKGRVPQHQIGAFAGFDAADFMRDTVGDGRVDRVFRNIAADAEIIVLAGFFGQATALFFHLVGGLPCTDQHLAHAAHRLTVGCNDGKGTHVMQDILGRDGFPADAAFGECHVFGDGFIQMVTDHQHVQMFVYRVDGEGPCRVGRGGQNKAFAADFDNVRGVAAACAFGMKRVDGAALHGLYRMFDKPGFVQRVCVDHHLHIHRIGHAKAAINRGGGCSPILVQLQGAGPGANLFFQCGGQAGVALPRKGQIHRKRIGGLQHPPNVPRSGGAGGGQRAMRRAGATAQHGGQARMQRVLYLLRTDIVDMAVKPACGQNAPLARDHLGSRSNDDVHAGLGVGVARLANGVNAPIL